MNRSSPEHIRLAIVCRSSTGFVEFLQLVSTPAGEETAAVLLIVERCGNRVEVRSVEPFLRMGQRNDKAQGHVVLELSYINHKLARHS